jgi:Leucine-rich repeat (LRR) protein
MWEFDIDEYISSLPDDVETIQVIDKNVCHIPDLMRFKNLKILNCSCNNITSLPDLPPNLQELDCHHFKLRFISTRPTCMSN